MSRAAALGLACAWLCAIAAGPAAAQTPDPTLARIDTLVANSRFTEARTTLDRWLASPAGKAREGDVAAHALLLSGRLTAAADSALPIFLELALNHPSSRHAPEALLRLGQGYHALAQHDRAEGYLQRLVRDYPAANERATGLLWLARTQHARRRHTEACRTATQALAVPGADDDLRGLLELERARCTRVAAPTATRPAAPAPKSATTTSAGRFTIQVAAFRDLASARSLVARLRTRDIDARIVRIGSGSLINVRVGRYIISKDATDTLRRVRTIAPDATIASDVEREQSITQ